MLSALFIRRVGTLVLAFAMTLLLGSSSWASISGQLSTPDPMTFTMTEGYVESYGYNAPPHISICGINSAGIPFEFGGSANWPDFSIGYYGLGDIIAPRFVASGLDLRNWGLTINGIGINLGQFSGAFVGAEGAPLQLPTYVVSQVVLLGSASFELWVEDIFSFPPGTEFLMAATGTGIVEVNAVAILDHGPPYYSIESVRYTIYPTYAVPPSIPEPGTFIVWSLLGSCATSLRRSRD